MKVNVMKSSENEIKLEVEGAGHSLLNVLQKTLLTDEKIEIAGYHIPHPLIDSGILYVQTKENYKPEVAILEATKKVLVLNKDFQKAFKKVSKAYKQK
ncbi:DNA-directed RNA polymerase subunit L [Candidatus Bathyarchaeota archaeon]|nr:DNA-directed RNA polymerase subunit L [Candidatus Bathyarchaeota archaeon]